LLKKGRIAKVGTYAEVKEDSFIQNLKSIHDKNQKMDALKEASPDDNDSVVAYPVLEDKNKDTN
jgi:hypothetical protein